ncbi:MAG: helix-turn-helix domain-containing protein [Dehalococcoidia bacterium]|nr:helix-turn-helix domain-containing protein [Dehalococcoidia bacterium]
MPLADPALLHRAAVHHALGDPLRLAVVDALALSDRAPSELEVAFEVPSNLLAHHLRILESAGILERTVSDGDRRRRYLRLTAAHREALDLPATVEAARVLFVCSANSARSPLAEALWRRAATGIEAASAGTHPAAAIHPLAQEAATRAGLRLVHAPTNVTTVQRAGDLVVTVCDQAHEERDGADDLHWSVPDPATGGTPRDFDRALKELETRVATLVRSTRARKAS